MKSSVDLSIIVLNYNAGQLLLDNLALLHKTFTKDVAIEVILADNGSTDGSFAQAKKQFAWVIPVDNKENLGFAKGNNRAIPHAKGDYVLFLNPDMRIEDQEVWPKLLGKMQNNPRVGALGCRVVFANGRYDRDSMRSFPSLWNSVTHFSKLSKLFPGNYLFDSYNLGYLDPTREHEVPALPGSFLLVRRDAGEAISWWDEDYFFYGEDLEFCWDLAEKGWKCLYTPEVTVTHYKGVSSGIRKESQAITKASNDTRRRIAHESVEAMRIFYKKHYNKGYPPVVSFFVFKALNILEQKRVSKYK